MKEVVTTELGAAELAILLDPALLRKLKPTLRVSGPGRRVQSAVFRGGAVPASPLQASGNASVRVGPGTGVSCLPTWAAGSLRANTGYSIYLDLRRGWKIKIVAVTI